jgi:hypothetical protein
MSGQHNRGSRGGRHKSTVCSKLVTLVIGRSTDTIGARQLASICTTLASETLKRLELGPVDGECLDPFLIARLARSFPKLSDLRIRRASEAEKQEADKGPQPVKGAADWTRGDLEPWVRIIVVITDFYFFVCAEIQNVFQVAIFTRTSFIRPPTDVRVQPLFPHLPQRLEQKQHYIPIVREHVGGRKGARARVSDAQTDRVFVPRRWEGV